jgi:cytidine deaminase
MTSDRRLIELALQARQNAYSPYSHFAVGAALLTKSGRVFTGCNIESASFSPTNCAERTAVFKAVSEGERDFQAIAVAGGHQSHTGSLPSFTAPCGVCRQVLAEFADPDLRIILAKSPDDYQVFSLDELLPLQFTGKSLR